MPDIPLDELQEQVTQEQLCADINARLPQNDSMHAWVSGGWWGNTFTMDCNVRTASELADLLRSAAESLEG